MGKNLKINIALTFAKIAKLLLLLFAVFSYADDEQKIISGFDPTTNVNRERSFGADFSKQKYLVLCYHDIPVKITDDRDDYAVELENFVLQIEFLISDGFNFISPEDVLAASEGKKELPEKSVLLSFDDAYESFYQHVFPLLKIYKIPAMLAVVPSWIELGELSEYKKKFMTWDQIREVSDSGLVHIASHSLNMHKSVVVHPLGSTAAALVSRIYDEKKGRYENKEEYELRISQDISESHKILSGKIGKMPVSFVWPYGRYNSTAVDFAKKSGFKLLFTLDAGLAEINNPDAVPRYIMMGNPAISEFAKNFRKKFVKYQRDRIVHADIDPLYDEKTEQMIKNIDKFVERIYKIKPHAVYLQAFCDKDGDGNVDSLYFPNRILPVKADIFGRIARALSVRGIAVYAWMPMLSFSLADKELNSRLRVCEFRSGKIQPSSSWYERWSPFSREAQEKILAIYEDLATYCSFEGIIFQDDGYLNDYEDFHPEALPFYFKATGRENLVPFQELSAEAKSKWTAVKTEKINELSSLIMGKVLLYRPETLFARTIYAPVLTNPESEEWFCQNYEKCLKAYNYTVIMAYPRMEKKFWERTWLRELVKKSSGFPNGLSKTVFKVQAYDWNDENWISDATLRKWIRTLISAGAYHVSYYPDGLFEERPGINTARDIMSARDFPFDKPAR